MVDETLAICLPRLQPREDTNFILLHALPCSPFNSSSAGPNIPLAPALEEGPTLRRPTSIVPSTPETRPSDVPVVTITGMAALGKRPGRPMENIVDRRDRLKSARGTEAPVIPGVPTQPGSPTVELPDEVLDCALVPVLPGSRRESGVETLLGKVQTSE